MLQLFRYSRGSFCVELGSAQVVSNRTIDDVRASSFIENVALNVPLGSKECNLAHSLSSYNVVNAWFVLKSILQFFNVVAGSGTTFEDLPSWIQSACLSSFLLYHFTFLIWRTTLFRCDLLLCILEISNVLM